MKLPKSIRKKYRGLQEPILVKIEEEQEWQIELREMSKKETDDKELKRLKSLLEDSIKRCEVLRQSLDEYGKLSKSSWRISPDTFLTVMANIGGILLILNFEKIDIVRSKAFGLLMKGKI